MSEINPKKLEYTEINTKKLGYTEIYFVQKQTFNIILLSFTLQYDFNNFNFLYQIIIAAHYR